MARYLQQEKGSARIPGEGCYCFSILYGVVVGCGFGHILDEPLHLVARLGAMHFVSQLDSSFLGTHLHNAFSARNGKEWSYEYFVKVSTSVVLSCVYLISKRIMCYKNVGSEARTSLIN